MFLTRILTAAHSRLRSPDTVSKVIHLPGQEGHRKALLISRPGGEQLLSAIRVDSPQGLYSATLQQAAPSRCTFLANPSRRSCPWAAVYYQQLHTRGKSHAFFSLTATYVHSFDVSSLKPGS
jgi:hypothetical protein